MAGFNTFTELLRLEALQSFCDEHGEHVAYPKGSSIVEEGSVCRYLGIVTSGYFKYVTVNSRGEECVTGFSFRGEVVTDFVSSFLFGTPSPTTIVAGCDTMLQRVSISAVKEFLLVHDPEFVSHASAVLLREGYDRYLSVYRMTPAERYAALLERIGRDIDIIPLRELASFLNVSRRQFHRIRENL